MAEASLQGRIHGVFCGALLAAGPTEKQKNRKNKKTRRGNTQMTETNYDIVTIGSGHNGLVAAAYLAAAGRKVLVVERQPWFGGGVITRELTVPGFKHDQHSMAHIFIQANPLIKDDELGLISKFGLKYIYPEIPLMSVFKDGSTLALYTDRQRTYQEIARFSQKDAESYLRLSELGATWLPAIVGGMFSVPAPTGAMYAFMDQSREGRLMMSIMQKSAYDIVKEYFTDERVLLHFTRMVSETSPGRKKKARALDCLCSCPSWKSTALAWHKEAAGSCRKP